MIAFLVALILASVTTVGSVAGATEGSVVPLSSMSLNSKSKQTHCLIQATRQVLPAGWVPTAFLASNIETSDKLLASITFIARNVKLGEGTTFDLLITSFDPQGWASFKIGSEVGLTTALMKPTAQLVQRRHALRIGIVDLAHCQ